jgi:hypothetical protein
METLEQAVDEADLRKSIDNTRAKIAEIHASVDRMQLPMWTIFGPGTSDHPGLHVARLWLTLPKPVPTDVVVRSSSLEELRTLLPSDLTCIPRQASDDANIIETWL